MATATWLVGTVSEADEVSVSLPPVSMTGLTRMVPLAVALLPMASPSLISLWG